MDMRTKSHILNFDVEVQFVISHQLKNILSEIKMCNHFKKCSIIYYVDSDVINGMSFFQVLSSAWR